MEPINRFIFEIDSKVYADGMECVYCITLQRALDEIKLGPVIMGQNTQDFPGL